MPREKGCNTYTVKLWIEAASSINAGPRIQAGGVRPYVYRPIFCKGWAIFAQKIFWHRPKNCYAPAKLLCLTHRTQYLLVKILDFGHFILLDRMNSVFFSFTKYNFFLVLAAGCPKNLAFAQKIMALPESGGCSPIPCLVRLWLRKLYWMTESGGFYPKFHTTQAAFSRTFSRSTWVGQLSHWFLVSEYCIRTGQYFSYLPRCPSVKSDMPHLTN